MQLYGKKISHTIETRDMNNRMNRSKHTFQRKTRQGNARQRKTKVCSLQPAASTAMNR